MSRAARLGAFIIATLAILAVGIFIIGDRQYLFSNTYQLKAQFANVVGLNEGAEVRVGGVHSGTVRRIDLPKNPTDKITVLMDLQRSTHDIIKQDSVAAIQTEGLLGNEYVSITFGGAQARTSATATPSPASLLWFSRTSSKKPTSSWTAPRTPSPTPPSPPPI